MVWPRRKCGEDKLPSCCTTRVTGNCYHSLCDTRGAALEYRWNKGIQVLNKKIVPTITDETEGDV